LPLLFFSSFAPVSFINVFGTGVCELTLQEFFRTIHVVIAGHISSDALGLNLLLDAVEKQGPLTIVECSGFKRIRRQN
jgi:hypothetical protein